MPFLKSYSNYTLRMVQAFTKLYCDQIVDAITNTGIFFPLVIGQLTSESHLKLSADGSLTASTLATQYNNWGGIQGHGVQMDSTEVRSGVRVVVKKEWFATYPDFPSFMQAYVSLLMTGNGGRYLPALQQASSPEEQIIMIVDAGYSTLKPKDYLKQIQNRIDASRDSCPWGRINTVVPQGNPGIALGEGLLREGAALNGTY